MDLLNIIFGGGHFEIQYGRHEGHLVGMFP